MTRVRVSMIDLYVARPAAAGLEFLVLRRSTRGRSPGAWEAVHGHLEEGERPTDGALREMLEETGLTPVPCTTSAASRRSTSTGPTKSR